MKNSPYSFYVALDGPGLNGIEGYAGACLFQFDPDGDQYDFKIKYFDGAASGHCPSINPDKTVGFLGNFAQHLLFYDPETLEEMDRISTLTFENNDTTIRGTTHVVWLNPKEFLTVIGDYFYRFSVDRLSKPEKLGPHKVKIPHAMRLTHSKRYVCYGSLDHPKRGEAREAGVFDLETGEATRIELPTTCWHLVQHPSKDLFYPISYRVLPRNNHDYHEWAIGYFKQYAFEVDAAEKKITRHWAVSRDMPVHLNSDVTISDSELIFCAAGSHTILFINLDDFSTYRVLEEKPNGLTLLRCVRQMATGIYESFARGSVFSESHHVLATIRVTRFTVLDGTYACQLSKDQKFLFTANRGQNRIVVYDYPSLNVRLNVKMPSFHKFNPHMHFWEDPRLGFHHGYLLSPAPGL